MEELASLYQKCPSCFFPTYLEVLSSLLFLGKEYVNFEFLFLQSKDDPYIHWSWALYEQKVDSKLVAHTLLLVEEMFNSELGPQLTRMIPGVYLEVRERLAEKVLELKEEAYRFTVLMLFVIGASIWFAIYRRTKKSLPAKTN